MPATDKLRMIFKLFTLGILASCLVLLRINQSQGTSSSSQQQIRLIAEPQTDAPLRVSSIVNSSSNPLAPQLMFSVENIGKKDINAYAIRHIALFGGAQSEGVSLSNILQKNRVLQPGQSVHATLEGDEYSAPVIEVTLIIDFVEFTDGQTWGADKSKSGERLTGMRAGAQAETERILSLARGKGTSAIVEAIMANSESLTAPTGRSSQWTEGFREGVGFRHSQLVRAIQQGANIEEELQRPYDASEKRWK
jgi:hypothetical protein